MHVLPGASIVATDAEVAELLDWLHHAVSARHAAPGLPLCPLPVLHLLDGLAKAAGAGGRNPRVPSWFRESDVVAAWQRKPEWLSIAEAAGLADVSQSFARRLCRARVWVTAPRRTDRSPWRVDALSVATWRARHREEHDDTQAA